VEGEPGVDAPLAEGFQRSNRPVLRHGILDRAEIIVEKGRLHVAARPALFRDFVGGASSGPMPRAGAGRFFNDHDAQSHVVSDFTEAGDKIAVDPIAYPSAGRFIK
jgi:hypothetical protein